VVVVFLAGHGKAHRGEYHFIPSDFRYTSDQAYEQGRTLSNSKLTALFQKRGAGKLLLILDTCHSGAVIKNPLVASRPGAEEKDALAILMKKTGRYILAAASPEGRALEEGTNGHGIYTWALLEGLSGKAAAPGTDRIELDALAQYLEDRVPQLTKPFGYQQIPMRSAEGQTFWLIRRPGQP